MVIAWLSDSPRRTLHFWASASYAQDAEPQAGDIKWLLGFLYDRKNGSGGVGSGWSLSIKVVLGKLPWLSWYATSVL